jgi:spore coat protein H
MRNFAFILLLFLLATAGCRKHYVNGTDLETPDWTEATHSNKVQPNFNTVFDESKVNRFDIVISNKDWSTTQNDLHYHVQTGGVSSAIDNNWTPVYVPCSFFFNGKEWYKVGIRYTSNSSLQYCVNTGIKKYSFKLNFDHFEDQYVTIKNQRFYGFKELSLHDNFGDPSMMREKTAADLFREFGVPAPHAVFCEIWVDFGIGAKYFGLYTLEEEVSNTVISEQFQKGGNLYKPDGIAATLAPGTYDTAQFYKKTNLSPSDYTDIQSLYNIINSDSRIINYEGWKSALESAFDVQVFLKWLAANTVIQDWDTYGLKHHNYYLYNNPSTEKLTWIPWDNGGSFVPAGDKTALSLSLDEVTAGWPLIRNLIDEADYRNTYRSYVSAFVQSPFSVSSFSTRIDNQAALIQQHVSSEAGGYTFLNSYSDFEQALLYLKQHAQNRADAVSLFLSR